MEETSVNPILFLCPKCGKIPQDQVIFLCNQCKEEELIQKDGLYMCPACLRPGENFECMGCGSKKVKISPKDRSELNKNL
jgi:predicted RNA-binding Zn-ribbon protein involved in translation (DUF1610 family)